MNVRTKPHLLGPLPPGLERLPYWWSDGPRFKGLMLWSVGVNVRVPALSTAKAGLAPRVPTAPDARNVQGFAETELVSSWMASPRLRSQVLGPLEAFFFPNGCWRAFEVLRDQLFGLECGPGDFDVLLGPTSTTGPRFDAVVGLEIKVGRASADGRPRFSSHGTGQAVGLIRAGCVAAVVLHVVKAAPTSGPDRGFLTMFGERVFDATDALIRYTRPHLRGPTGYVVATCGHPSGSSVMTHSGVYLMPVVRPKAAPHVFGSGDRLQRALARLWSRFGAGTTTIRRCPRCQTAVAVPESGTRQCPECATFWMEDVQPAQAEDVRPLPYSLGGLGM